MAVQPLKTDGLVADVVVIGGGLHGCSAALQLARSGLSVTLLEKDSVGRHASGVNAGGVRRLGRAFAELPLASASARLWHNINSLVDDDCGFTPSSQISVAENEDELKQQLQRIEQLKQLGFKHERFIDTEELRVRLPAASHHCVGGVIVEGDGHANPFRTVQAFRRACERQGVRIHQQTPVRDIRNHAGVWRVESCSQTFEAKFLVNCAGAWGGEIAARLGEEIPVRAGAPMLMISNRMPPFVAPVVGAKGRTLSFKQFANGTVLIGGGFEGTAFPDQNRTRLNFSHIAENARTAVDIFPIMSRARIVRCWAGIEGLMPDRLPVIGPGQGSNIFHAFGFSAHGFQLGPIVGQIIRNLVLGAATNLPISAFRADRFKEPSVYS